MAERMGVKCLNTFAFDMFHVICSESTKNEFISPFSVLTALNMALVGAKKNTKKEMFEGLRYNLGFSDTFEVHCFFKKLLDDYKQFDLCNLILANRALLHKSPNFRVNPDYAAHIAYFYGSELNEANFITDKEAIIHTCNEWVNEKTNGKIPSILNSLHRDDRAVLVNAIYFKGKWQNKFEEYCTRTEKFYNFGDKEKAKNVPMMHAMFFKPAVHSSEIAGEELLMLELPYRGSIEMCLLMTKSLNGMQKIEPHLNFKVIQKVEYVSYEVANVSLPKFKMEGNYNLVKYLKEMGIIEPFLRGKADFGGVSEDDKELHISSVFHKTAIEVNEHGTEAAAATVFSLRGGFVADPTKTIDLVFDHPFVYFIKDRNSNVILFTGRVNEL